MLHTYIHIYVYLRTKWIRTLSIQKCIAASTKCETLVRVLFSSNAKQLIAVLEAPERWTKPNVLCPLLGHVAGDFPPAARQVSMHGQQDFHPNNNFGIAVGNQVRHNTRTLAIEKNISNMDQFAIQACFGSGEKLLPCQIPPFHRLFQCVGKATFLQLPKLVCKKTVQYDFTELPIGSPFTSCERCKPSSHD